MQTHISFDSYTCGLAGLCIAPTITIIVFQFTFDKYAFLLSISIGSKNCLYGLEENQNRSEELSLMVALLILNSEIGAQIPARAGISYV